MKVKRERGVRGGVKYLIVVTCFMMALMFRERACGCALEGILETLLLARRRLRQPAVVLFSAIRLQIPGRQILRIKGQTASGGARILDKFIERKTTLKIGAVPVSCATRQQFVPFAGFTSFRVQGEERVLTIDVEPSWRRAGAIFKEYFLRWLTVHYLTLLFIC